MIEQLIDEVLKLNNKVTELEAKVEALAGKPDWRKEIAEKIEEHFEKIARDLD
jgi:outer membrane murein-binding lipoprotein Lpp